MHAITNEYGGQANSQTPRQDSLSGPQWRPSASPSPVGSPILLNDEQAAEALGISPRKLAELSREPWFPPAVMLGPRLKRYVRSELEAAAAIMPRWRPEGGEPAQLRRGKIEAMKARGVAA